MHIAGPSLIISILCRTVKVDASLLLRFHHFETLGGSARNSKILTCYKKALIWSNVFKKMINSALKQVPASVLYFHYCYSMCTALLATSHGLKNRLKTSRFSRKPEKPIGYVSSVFKKRLVKFEIFKNLKKKSKKTRVHFKIFGQNIIPKFKITHPTKFDEVKIV
jgi:hypothetical protein